MSADILVKTSGLSHEEWLAWRNKGIGGSDIAILLGISRYKSPMSLYLEKAGLKEPDDLSDNEAVYWGNVLEEVVAQEFSSRTGMKVRKRNAILKHPEHEWALANVDRLIIGKREGLECKTTNEYKKGEWSTEQVPDEYFLQCQWYMAVTGFLKWHIAVLIGGNKFKHFEIERDEELIESLLQRAGVFWNEHVKLQNPPAWDGSDDASDLLKSLYPQEMKGTQVELPPRFETKAVRYDELKVQADDLKKEMEQIKQEIQETMGDHEVGYIGDRKVKWAGYDQTRIDSKTLKAERPEIFQEYSKTSYVRKFTI